MQKQKISLIVILLLMMNLFLEKTISHSDITAEFSEKIIISEIIFNNQHTEQNQQHTGHEHCANETCHSGFCKLIKSTANLTSYNPDQSEQYSTVQFIIPESPYLIGNRRPPKYNL